MSEYTEFKYHWPPRPDNAIPPELLNFYERKGWWGQFKKNGTCSIIAISPEKEFTAMNRHNSTHKTWSLNDYLKTELIKLFPEKVWYVLVAEILHLKTAEIKNTIYIFDMLVWKSEFLFDSTFAARQEILDKRLVTKVEEKTHYVCDHEGKGKIWYAKRFEGGFFDLWMGIEDPKVDEGLVLKNPEGKLKSCRAAKDNTSWQVKCRKKHKNYAF